MKHLRIMFRLFNLIQCISINLMKSGFSIHKYNSMKMWSSHCKVFRWNSSKDIWIFILVELPTKIKYKTGKVLKYDLRIFLLFKETCEKILCFPYNLFGILLLFSLLYDWFTSHNCGGICDRITAIIKGYWIKHYFLVVIPLVHWSLCLNFPWDPWLMTSCNLILCV